MDPKWFQGAASVKIQWGEENFFLAAALVMEQMGMLPPQQTRLGDAG